MNARPTRALASRTRVLRWVSLERCWRSATKTQRAQPSQANPSWDVSADDSSPVINLVDAQYLLFAVAKKYFFLAKLEVELQRREGAASNDLVVRVHVMRPETAVRAPATPQGVDVLVEFHSNALADESLNFAEGSLAPTERSSGLGACSTMKQLAGKPCAPTQASMPAPESLCWVYCSCV